MTTAMRRKPVVGETLYSLNIGNAARRHPQTLTPVTVIAVGRKYFTAGPPESKYMHRQYHLDTWIEKPDYSDYCADSALYATEQEYEDEKRHSKPSTSSGPSSAVSARAISPASN